MARGGGSRIGTKITLKTKYAYGDPEEIANRDKGGFQPRATSFSQISPNDSGGNLNVPPHGVRSGKFKFNPPVN
jgi:hypothetical protein